MNLIIISQDKKSIWDFSQCCIFIPNDSIHEIFIRPYYASNGVSIATYEDPKKTEDVLKEIINLFSKSKMLLTPNVNMKLEDIETAKKYFDNLNGEKFIVSDSNFNITPIGNNYNLIYKLPEDVKNMNLDNLKLVTPEEHRKYYKNYRKQNCDVVSIQEQVKLGYLKFYIKDKYIYCENVITKECVIVGTLDNITIGIDLGQDSDKMFEALATIDAGSISRTKNGMYF